MPTVRTFLAAVLAAGLGVVPGCGDEQASDGLGSALAYVPPDSAFVMTVETDLGGDDLSALSERLAQGEFADEEAPGSIEEALRTVAEEAGLDYEADIEPLLGAPLVIAARSELVEGTLAPSLFALDTGDGEAARTLLEKLPSIEPAGEVSGAQLYVATEAGALAVRDDVLMFAEDEEAIAQALERADSGDGLDPERLGGEQGDLIRGRADVSAVLGQSGVRPLLSVPWFAALESATFSVSLDSDQVELTGTLATDPSALSDRDLPLPADAETPQVTGFEGELAGASANQSQTTSFLLEVVRTAFPDSVFVRDVAIIERRLGIDFEADVLRQFDGPSASSVAPSGEFAARSTVADPERLAAVMRRLAPDLGRLVQDLQALRTQGLIALFLVAPDAPIAPGVLGASELEVREIATDLYEISGLTETGPGAVNIPGTTLRAPIPDEIVFGLVEDVFVVASDEARAREIAAAELIDAPPGTEGASIAVADLADYREEIEAFLGFDPGPLGDAAAAASATTAEVTGNLRIELP